METKATINGLRIYVGGTWAEISDGITVICSSSVEEGASPMRVYLSWLHSLEPLWAGNARKGDYYRWFNGFCRVDYIGSTLNAIPLHCAISTSSGKIINPFVLAKEEPCGLRALDFDALYSSCCYATAGEVNNGYVCAHPAQQERDENSQKQMEGKCYCWSCPLGVQFSPLSEEEDAEALAGNPNIYWADGFSCLEDQGPDTDVFCDNDCLLVRDGTDATEDEKRAIQAHYQYLNRYN